MSGALYSRIKNWGTTDTLLASDLNAEFDNILTNLVPLMIDGYSANTTQMQVQTDPGEVGSESLATSLAGELARLRFEIAEIKGTTYHYTTASTSLSQLSSLLGTSLTSNRISSGRLSANSSQPMFLVPDGTAATVTAKGATTNLVYSVASTQYTISTNVTATSLTLAPASNNTCVVSDAALSSQAFSKLVGENGTTITIGTVGSNITALIGSYAAFKIGTEYFIARVRDATTLDRVMRGFFFDSADAWLARTTVANGATITLMKLTWVYANTAGALTVSYTNPRFSGTAPSSPATGDYWYDMVNNIWKTYNSTTFIAANATLIGVCLQDTSGTKAARSADIFKSFADTNSIECVKDSTTQVVSRYPGPQINVYGTLVKFTNDYVRWNTGTDLDSGESLTASTQYYFYVKENGNVTISTVAPHDRRADRLGYYHPAEVYRCVGYGRTDGSSQFQEIESLFATDRSTLVTNLTAAVSNLLPQPYAIQSKERTFLMNCSGVSAFTQVLPPAAQYIGETFTFVKTDANIPASSSNSATVQTYTSTDLIQGSNGTGTTVVLSTLGETVSLRGASSSLWVITQRYVPSNWVSYTPTLGGFGTASSVNFYWRRVGDTMEVQGAFVSGTCNATLASCSLPGTYTVDTGKIYNNTSANYGPLVGEWKNQGAAPNAGTYAITAVTTNTGVVYSSANGDTLKPAVGTTFSSSNFIAVMFKVPITGWSQ